jgi:hypothetical protein
MLVNCSQTVKLLGGIAQLSRLGSALLRVAAEALQSIDFLTPFPLGTLQHVLLLFYQHAFFMCLLAKDRLGSLRSGCRFFGHSVSSPQLRDLIAGLTKFL